MPLEVDQGRSPSSSSSYFSAEIHFPAQRKVGFWKSEDLLDNLASVDTALLPGKGSGLGQKYSGFEQLGPAGGKESKVDLNGFPYENGLFSSSLPELFHRRSTNYALFDQSLGMTNTNNVEDEPIESLKEIEAQTIGDLLPDDDELLFNVVEECENTAPQNGMSDFEDDLFSSIGGFELESNGVSSTSNGDMNNLFSGHPCIHPSRTLSVCNVNSNAEDSDLRVLFQRYGDIHTLFTANKHHGFVMVSYYDVRSACNAMRALQNMIFMHKKLDLHFLTVKEHPPHKDINQCAFVLVSLNSSLPNDLYQAFGAYGEIKKISDSSSRYDKIIEFYDVRAAEAARCALRSGIARKQIMSEFTHPINTRCLPQQFSYNLEKELANGYHKKGSSPSSSPSLHYGIMPFGAIMSDGLDSGTIQGKCSVSEGSTGSLLESGFSRNSSSVPHYLSSPVRISSLEKHSNHVAADDISHSLGHMSFGIRSMPGFRPHSLPDYHDDLGTISSSPLNFAGQSVGVDKIQISGLNSAGFSGVSLPNSDLAFGTSRNSGAHLHGRQYLPRGPIMWPSSPSFTTNIPGHPASQLHGLPMAPSSIFDTGMPVHHHHVGSAPPANPSLWERRGGFKGSLVEAPGFHPNSHENMGLSGSSSLHPLEFSPHNVFPHVGGNFLDSSMSSHAGISSPQQNCHVFHGGRSSKIPMPASFGTPGDRFRNRRSDTSLNQVENKQYELDIESIVRGEDARTTLMIKNIPNKYTSKMLLAAIDEHHRGTYDFIYLPIDFKNKCNVGYAFINIINPQQIIPFYKAFNGKKWEKFNSEKVASLAYARIQGKAALIAHFQNSSLMNEDKRCRPILFHSDGPNAGHQEPFPVGINVRSRSGRPRTQTNDDNRDGSPSNSSNGEDHSDELHYAADSVERLNE